MNERNKDITTAAAAALLWTGWLIIANIWFLSDIHARFFGVSVLGLTTLVGPLIVSPVLFLWLIYSGVQKRIPLWASGVLGTIVLVVSILCFLRTIQVHMTA